MQSFSQISLNIMSVWKTFITTFKEVYVLELHIFVSTSDSDPSIFFLNLYMLEEHIHQIKPWIT